MKLPGTSDLCRIRALLTVQNCDPARVIVLLVSSCVLIGVRARTS